MHSRKIFSWGARAAILSAAVVLCIGASSCNKNTPQNVAEAEAAAFQRSAQQRLQGTWVINSALYFERELASAPPSYIEELIHARKMGYRIEGDSLEYWVRTQTNMYVMRATYTVVSHEDDVIDIRVISNEEADEAAQFDADEDTLMIAGDAELLRFSFRTDDAFDHVPVYDSAADEAADADDATDAYAAHPIPVERVDEAAFNAYFELDDENVQYQMSADAETSQWLSGTWVMDHKASVAMLPEDQRPYGGLVVRISPMDLQFDAEQSTMKHREIKFGHPKEDSSGYRVARNIHDNLYIQLWRGSAEKVGETDAENVMRLRILDEDRISLRPLNPRKQMPETAGRVFVRVDQERLDAYLEDPTRVVDFDDKTRARFVKRLTGAWILDKSDDFESRIHAQFADDDKLLGIRYDGGDVLTMRDVVSGKEFEQDAPIVLADSSGNAVLAQLTDPDDPSGKRVEEMLFVFQDDGKLRLMPADQKMRSADELERDVIVLEKVSQKTFEKRFDAALDASTTNPQ